MTGSDFPLLIKHNMLANYRMIYIRSAFHWSQEIDHSCPGFSISNVARMVQCRWFTASESHQYHRFQLNIVPDVSSATLILISSLDFPMGPPTFSSFTHHNICADKLVSYWTNRLDDLGGGHCQFGDAMLVETISKSGILAPSSLFWVFSFLDFLMGLPVFGLFTCHRICANRLVS